jgi:hypothetical protein
MSTRNKSSPPQPSSVPSPVPSRSWSSRRLHVEEEEPMGEETEVEKVEEKQESDEEEEETSPEPMETGTAAAEYERSVKFAKEADRNVQNKIAVAEEADRAVEEAKRIAEEAWADVKKADRIAQEAMDIMHIREDQMIKERRSTQIQSQAGRAETLINQQAIRDDIIQGFNIYVKIWNQLLLKGTALLGGAALHRETEWTSEGKKRVNESMARVILAVGYYCNVWAGTNIPKTPENRQKWPPVIDHIRKTLKDMRDITLMLRIPPEGLAASDAAYHALREEIDNLNELGARFRLLKK